MGPDNRPVQHLIDRGVPIPTPASVDIGPDVDPDRISGERVVVHSACKIFGPRTLIRPGVELGHDLIRLKLQEIVPDYNPSAPADSYEPVG